MTSSSTSLRASTLSFQNRSTLDPGSPARHRPANPHAARHPVRSPASAHGRRNRRCTAREPSADETSARAIDARANTAIAPAPPLSAAAAERGEPRACPPRSRARQASPSLQPQARQAQADPQAALATVLQTDFAAMGVRDVARDAQAQPVALLLAGDRRKRGSKICSRRCSGTPGPSSSTCSTTASGPSSRLRRARSPYFSALSSRLPIQRLSARGLPG